MNKAIRFDKGPKKKLMKTRIILLDFRKIQKNFTELSKKYSSNYGILHFANGPAGPTHTLILAWWELN
jgi:hypothetical protein